MSSSRNERWQRAVDVFHQALEGLDSDEFPDLDTLGDQNPELADELRQVGQSYRNARTLLRRIEPERDGDLHDPGELLERVRSVARPALPGEFDQLEPIARSRNSQVFRAVDRRLGRPVAIKRIAVDTRAEKLSDRELRLLGRFLEEARLSGQLQHPNTLPIYEVLLDESGRPFFAMPLIEWPGPRRGDRGPSGQRLGAR